MDGRPTWTDCDEAGDFVVPNVLSPRDLVSRPDIMDETVPHTYKPLYISLVRVCGMAAEWYTKGLTKFLSIALCIVNEFLFRTLEISKVHMY